MKTTKEEQVNKPWRDINGKIKNDSALMQISRNWNAEIWERFLVDTVENKKEEILNEHGSAQDKNSFNNLKLYHAIKDLTKQQRTVIDLIFWKGFSQEEVARVMKISRGSVRVHFERSLSKLKGLLQFMSPDFHYIIEGQESEVQNNKTLKEQIHEVYLMDLKGNCQI